MATISTRWRPTWPSSRRGPGRSTGEPSCWPVTVLGAIVAAGAAALLGARCAGLVLVDGGFERVEETTGIDVEEFLRGLDEPPEVLRSP